MTCSFLALALLAAPLGAQHVPVELEGYGEHFAVSDVPSGVHLLRVKIGDAWVGRRVSVVAGALTSVEFRP